MLNADKSWSWSWFRFKGLWRVTRDSIAWCSSWISLSSCLSAPAACYSAETKFHSSLFSNTGRWLGRSPTVHSSCSPARCRPPWRSWSGRAAVSTTFLFHLHAVTSPIPSRLLIVRIWATAPPLTSCPAMMHPASTTIQTVVSLPPPSHFWFLPSPTPATLLCESVFTLYFLLHYFPHGQTNQIRIVEMVCLFALSVQFT